LFGVLLVPEFGTGRTGRAGVLTRTSGFRGRAGRAARVLPSGDAGL